MKVKSVRIEKINSDGSKTSKTVNSNNTKKQLEDLNKLDIDFIIDKVDKIKYKICEKLK